MRQFARFIAVIIIVSAPCILGDNKIYPIDINPEASKQAKELINELWPKLEEEAKANEGVASQQYERRLAILVEAAHRAETINFTRLAKEIGSLFTGENPQYDRGEIISLMKAENNDVTLDDVVIAAMRVQERDHDPKVSNEMIRQDAKRLLAGIGLLEIANQVQLFLQTQTELISLFFVLLITRRCIP